MKTDSPASGLFREEAVTHYFGHGASAGVLSLPLWSRPVVLLSGLLIVLAVLFAGWAELETPVCLVGYVPVAEAAPSPPAAERTLAISFPARPEDVAVQSGDAVRLEMAAPPPAASRLIAGRVIRVLPEPPPSDGIPQPDGVVSPSFRLEIAVLPAAAPPGGIFVRGGMPVKVHVAGRQRLLSITFHTMTKWLR